MSETLVIVGVLARVEAHLRAAVETACSDLPGVTVFGLADVDRIGLLIEAPDLGTAHALLRERIEGLPGVLGTWPVAVEMDAGDATQSRVST